ncbi:mediator-associated protein 2-like [Cicer arietinum]|uniref:Mediator-associated protein 2-like n=1 Tax=Cicer arietinum TaxID=3827 RepID=A0A1S3E688_CICAR|nr:mediator-associated protein 2-like [Cicer arietinum]XP_012570939.1 mediator-associated protein 2-like [Cicer arietinum]
MSNIDSDRYKPHVEFVEEAKEALIDLNLTESTELWLLKLPISNDLLTDIDGQELSLKLHNEGNLGTFKGASGKAYDFVSFASQEPDETVFVSSATEQKIAGKITRRVSVVHYPDPKELEAKQARRNSAAAATNTSQIQSDFRGSSRASASKSSRMKSSVSELSNTPKRRPYKNRSNGRPADESSHGHSTGVSAMSSDHSSGGKSKRRKI